MMLGVHVVCNRHLPGVERSYTYVLCAQVDDRFDISRKGTGTHSGLVGCI